MNETPSRLTAALSGRYRIERELGQGGMARRLFLPRRREERKETAVQLGVLRVSAVNSLANRS